MSFVSDLFSGSGQSDASAQAGRNQKIQKGAKGLFNQVQPQFSDLLSQLGHYDAGRAIGAALNEINASPSTRVAAFNNAAQENASKAASQNANFLKSQGYGDGAVAGAGAGFFQDAARQMNGYAAQQMDPEEQLRRILSYAQSYQGATGPMANLVSQLGALVYGAPQVQVQQSPFANILGQAAGMASSYYSGGATGAARGVQPPNSSTPFYH